MNQNLNVLAQTIQ